MTVKIYITSIETQQIRRLKLSEKDIIPAVEGEDAVAIQMNEIISSITESISSSLEVESALTIEIAGSVGLKIEGGTKYLFFNVSGGVEAHGSMKVTLATTIKPKIEYSNSKTVDMK